jgi:hypothetical protein
MTTIHITKFVRRQTPESGYTHWTISDEELLARVQAGLPSAKPGYRDGVLLVPVSPDGFLSGLVRLKEGDVLIGEYKARRAGEEPRKSTYALGEKAPAKSCWVVLYSHATLLEGKENETNCDYEIVSVNASPEVEDAPIPTGALIANHYELSGGTSTKMNEVEFQEALRKSVEFWKDKAMVAPANLRPKPKLDQRGIDIVNSLVVGWAKQGDFLLHGGESYASLMEWLDEQGCDRPQGLEDRIRELTQ